MSSSSVIRSTVKQASLLAMLAAVALLIPMTARAQGPLTPPARPPVPMSATDEAPPQKPAASVTSQPAAKTTQTSDQIKVALPSTSRHISTGNAAYDAIIYEAAGLNGLDPCLIVSVMRAESGFNRMAVSPKGASGLMQLMPATAERFGVKNIFDPRENILAGARYLRWLLDRFEGDVRLALAGYNAGEGAVELYGYRIPPFLETQNYVRTIYTRYSGLHLGAVAAGTSAASRPVPEPAKIAEPPADGNPSYNQIIRFTSVSGDSVKSGK